MPASHQPAKRRRRCAYFESGVRCTRDGQGNPPLCPRHTKAHLVEVEQRSAAAVMADAMMDFLSGKPINREATIGAAEQMFAQWAQTMGAGYSPGIRGGDSEGSVHRRAQSGAQDDQWWREFVPGAGRAQQGPRRPPPVDHDAQRLREARANARRVMGFTQDEKLTEEVIKLRHRELSKRHHPDRGGSTEKMAAVNNAADILRESL